jgi:hypothetical protein
MIILNKTPTRCTINLKVFKNLFTCTLLYMFRALLCPSSGASAHCTCSLWSPCAVGLDVASRLEATSNPINCASSWCFIQYYQLLQFAPTNAHNFVTITIILLHTSYYMFWATVLYNRELPDEGPPKPETCGSWCVLILV